MRFRVVVSPKAEGDIELQAAWWARNRSVAQAEKWLSVVGERLATLSYLPERHGLSAENQSFPYEIRDLLIGLGPHPRHRAVFTIREDVVYVLALRSIAQDAVRISDVDVVE